MPKNKSGFTLIELLVTIAIIGILASVGLVVYSSTQKTARISKRVQDLKAIQAALETFKAAKGKYPSVTVAGSFVCLNSLSGNNSLTPNFMQTVPDDPLGSSYCYQYSSDGIGNAPAANNYKARTNDNLPNSEMGSEDYKQQANMIDPDRDGTGDDDCAVQTSGNITGWAVYSSDKAACNW